MELYLLDDNFLKYGVVDVFESVIWTERYREPGDVVLELEASPLNASTFLPGVKLGMSDTDEVMLVDTQSVENDVLTVTGPSLLGFMDERPFRDNSNPADTVWNELDGSAPLMMPVGTIMQRIVEAAAISTAFGNGLDTPHERIPNLSIGAIDATGPSIVVSVAYGSALEALTSLAEDSGIGMRLYLESATTSGFTLKFTAYRGLDRTSGQSVNALVQFSTDRDTLNNPKELHSVKGYKNVAYAFRVLAVPGEWPPGGTTDAPGIAYAPGTTSATSGFARRSMQVLVSDLTEEQLAHMTIPQQLAFLTQRAADALANNNFTRVVDGEVVPQNEYVYGTHYKLGDLVELKGLSNQIQTARITEYIRAKDATGERSYPTVSVI